MNVASLYAEASRRADERFDEILVRLLTADIPEPLPDPSCPCPKCTRLLHLYIRTKIALHRYRQRDSVYWRGCDPVPGETLGGVFLLEARVQQAKSEFHSASCECGQFLWKGRRWHERQRLLRLQAASNQ